MSSISVLIVDDEENVRSALRRTLRKTGYDLLFADGGRAALELLKKQPVDVVLSDHLMPGMTGLQLLREVRRLSPYSGRIMLTGHTDLDTAMAAIRQGDIDRFLTKPWDDIELRVALKMAAEKLHAESENRRLLGVLQAQDGEVAPSGGSLENGQVGGGAENTSDAPAPGTPATAEASPEAALETPKLVHSRPVSARILIVEDSRTQAEWLAEVLAREGYEVRIAPDGRDAIRQVRSDPPDLVLLDMILPDMDGLEVLRIVKARSEDQFIPVILLSVKSDLDSRVAGLRIGADDFLAKPFADAEIQARAAAMLRIKLLQDQLRSAKSQLEKLSVTDGLTGLYNHRHFEDRLREEFRRCQRYSDPVSLLMMDLDHFKDVNDRYGHPFGDRVLRETADLLKSSIREPDICSRYGGEEFAIILPKTHLQGALAVAERIFKALRQKTYPIDLPPGDASKPSAIRVTASAGLAFFPSKDVTTPELLVKFADEALYRAKREGRDTICLYQAQSYRYDAGAR
jgi:two-component system, cell cycle response regulator